MDSQVQGAIIGASATAAVGLLSAFVAWKIGSLHFGAINRSHALNISKATPRIGCQVTPTEQNDLGPAFNPHIYLTVEIYNEGELPVRSVTGQWKLLTPNPSEKRVRDIRRDFLGKCEKHTDRYRIEESANWRREGIRFDVEVEFFYVVPGEKQERYVAQYRYDRTNRQMLKMSDQDVSTSQA